MIETLQRYGRVILRTLSVLTLTAVLGAWLTFIHAASTGGPGVALFIPVLLVAGGAAFAVFATVPALGYSIAMECWCARAYPRPVSRMLVYPIVFSVILALLTAFLLERQAFATYVYFGFSGILGGAMLGGIESAIEVNRPKPNKSPEPTPTSVMPAAEQPSRRP